MSRGCPFLPQAPVFVLAFLPRETPACCSAASCTGVSSGFGAKSCVFSAPDLGIFPVCSASGERGGQGDGSERGACDLLCHRLLSWASLTAPPKGADSNLRDCSWQKQRFRGEVGIKLGWAACKASALPHVFSLQPWEPSAGRMKRPWVASCGSLRFPQNPRVWSQVSHILWCHLGEVLNQPPPL